MSRKRRLLYFVSSLLLTMPLSGCKDWAPKSIEDLVGLQDLFFLQIAFEESAPILYPLVMIALMVIAISVFARLFYDLAKSRDEHSGTVIFVNGVILMLFAVGVMFFTVITALFGDWIMPDGLNADELVELLRLFEFSLNPVELGQEFVTSIGVTLVIMAAAFFSAIWEGMVLILTLIVLFSSGIRTNLKVVPYSSALLLGLLAFPYFLFIDVFIADKVFDLAETVGMDGKLVSGMVYVSFIVVVILTQLFCYLGLPFIVYEKFGFNEENFSNFVRLYIVGQSRPGHNGSSNRAGNGKGTSGGGSRLGGPIPIPSGGGGGGQLLNDRDNDSSGQPDETLSSAPQTEVEDEESTPDNINGHVDGNSNSRRTRGAGDYGDTSEVVVNSDSSSSQQGYPTSDTRLREQGNRAAVNAAATALTNSGDPRARGAGLLLAAVNNRSRSQEEKLDGDSARSAEETGETASSSRTRFRRKTVSEKGRQDERLPRLT